MSVNQEDTPRPSEELVHRLEQASADVSTPRGVVLRCLWDALNEQVDLDARLTNAQRERIDNEVRLKELRAEVDQLREERNLAADIGQIPANAEHLKTLLGEVMRAYRCDRCNGPLVGHFTITCGHTMCRACVLHQVMLRKAQCPFCPMQKLWGKGLCYPLKTVREWIDGVRGRNRPDIVLGQETIKRLHANERLVAYDRRYQRDAVAGRTAATAIDVDGMLPSRPVRRAVLSLQRA